MNRPITVCEQNPHYYSFDGKPILLITSAEHYGGVINLDFDYIAYFDRLREYELNYTRIYPGAHVEKRGYFPLENPVAPEPGSLILPWKQTQEPGGAHGTKFDLETWNEQYFLRLRDFIGEAAARGIFVEICFYNAQYPEMWSVAPFNRENNVQGFGDYDCNDFQTTLHKDWLKIQKAYVRKLTKEVNEYDNVILEICDEPTTMGTPSPLATEWVSEMADVIVETERSLPKKHLIAQQLETEVDFTADPRIPVIVTQYIQHNQYRQVGGVEALDTEYGHGKPIEMNESAWYPIWYEEHKVEASRVEAWEFMVGGGAAYNHLNGRFTCSDPTGNTPDNLEVLNSLRNLKHFLYRFDFVKMLQDKEFVKSGVPQGAWLRCISEPGRQYALYLHHSRLGRENWWYVPEPGDYRAELEVELPEGKYALEWILPVTGKAVRKETVAHQGGRFFLVSPRYELDIALSIRKLYV
jgi:hypothetical protein